MTKGVFITFEGGEGAGKTTIIDRVYDDLLSKNIPVIKTIEPGGTAIGEKIREVLLFSNDGIDPHCELALFLASRAQHVQELITPALEEGKVVLCDRFHDSTVAYQGIARGLGENKVKEFCFFFSHHLEPILTLYLDIPPKIGLKRTDTLQIDRIEKEKIEFHEKVREAFMKFHDENPKRIKLIDASLSIESVFSDVMKHIGAFI